MAACPIVPCASDPKQTKRATAGELAKETGLSKSHVHKTLGDLAETGDVEVREHVAEHGAHLYSATAGLPTTPGFVDLEPAAEDDQAAETPVCGSSTWALSITAPTASGSAAPSPEEPVGTGEQGDVAGDVVGLEPFDRGPPPG